jgi:chromosome segregation ATPase
LLLQWVEQVGFYGDEMMSERAGGMSFLEEKWLQDLVEKVGYQLHVRKKRDILLCEIEKRAGKSEHIQGRIAISRGELERTERTIEALERKLGDSMGESRRLRMEREQEEEKFFRLKEASKDIEKKLAALPRMREEIKKLEGVVQRSTRRLEALRSDHGETLQRKVGLEQACKASKTGIAGLEQEISVMRDTFTLLTGQRPEDFDPETFDAIHDDVEKKVDDFTSEMMGQIEKVKEDTLSLEAQLEEKTAEKRALLLKKGEIQEVVKGLKGQVDGEERAEDIEVELNSLKAQEGKTAVDILEKKAGIQRLESATGSVVKRIRREELLGAQFSERHAYLKTRKEEMDRLENVAEEIERLRDETSRHMTTSKADWSLHETVRDLIGNLEQVNQDLVSTVEKHDQRFSEFEKEIEGLLTTERKLR